MSVPTHICAGNVTADPEIDSEWVTEHEQFDPVVIPNPDNMLDPELPTFSDAEGDIMFVKCSMMAAPITCSSHHMQ